MLNKLLAAAFVGIFLGKLFFRPQLRALGKRLDGFVNAMLVAIVLVYSVQAVLWLFGGQ